MTRSTRVALVLTTLLAATPAVAQQTTGSVAGRIADEQDAAVPGVTVTATNHEIGFVRSATSDEAGLYRLPALPVGLYDVVFELQGFTRVERNSVIVNVSRVTDLNITVRIAQVAETVTVSGASPLIATTASSLGEVVDIARIQSLPLNGRQFANLAATVPGVSLGFNSETTKSSQYSPQVSGGNGRNINYLIDGGDNNDDTTGGLLQLFPLEAIQEFNVLTHRFNAEYGRSNGAVLNVVTRSGTNTLRGSWFTLFRDDALNAITTSEQTLNVAKSAYRRYQYGGSVGGPIVQNRVHYFGAFERMQQDTKQPVNTLGLFPANDGVYDVPYRETMFTGKATATLTGAQYLAIRYGHNKNSQPNQAGLRFLPEAWSTSTNTFHSLNGNHNWVMGPSALNELIAQVSTFDNVIPGSSDGPTLMFPNGVRAGANPVAPQATEQEKWQLRDDFTWALSGIGGLGHDLKAGVNWIHEPRLFISTTSLFTGLYVMGGNSLNAPVLQVQKMGGQSAVNMPVDQFGIYVQDDWRATARLTLNLGVRWDYVTGMPLDQSANPNFQVMQAAGRAGRFAGTALSDFGQETRGDKDNIQPRLGFVYDLRGDGGDVIRGGWGIYTDFGYTNANQLTAAIDTVGGAGPVFVAQSTTGLLKADGTLFRTTDPLSTIQHLNLVNPNQPLLNGSVVSPLLEQPYTRQASIGWAHELGAQTAITADYVRVDGRDLNIRIRPNVLVNGRRALADLPLIPNAFNQNRFAISKGSSQYDALILALRRRLSGGLDLNGSYTLSKATSNVGAAYDELDLNLIQDVSDPFGPVQDGPNARTDARHRVTVTAIVEAPWGIRVAPFFLYRSRLPIHTAEGLDLNGDGNIVDKTAVAYRYTGLDGAGRATFEEMGPCETVNCSRKAPFSQLNLRVSRSFRLMQSARIEAIAEVFNLFNAKNPSHGLTTSLKASTGAPNTGFLVPNAYAGDVGQPEQRIGQVGFRVTF